MCQNFSKYIDSVNFVNLKINHVVLITKSWSLWNRSAVAQLLLAKKTGVTLERKANATGVSWGPEYTLHQYCCYSFLCCAVYTLKPICSIVYICESGLQHCRFRFSVVPIRWSCRYHRHLRKWYPEGRSCLDLEMICIWIPHFSRQRTKMMSGIKRTNFIRWVGPHFCSSSRSLYNNITFKCVFATK